MNYNFPETKFVIKNDSEEQLKHVLSESDEIADATAWLEVNNVLEDHAGIAEAERELHVEALDKFHSLETYFRILEREKGSFYVEGLRTEVINKNQKRGYYVET